MTHQPIIMVVNSGIAIAGVALAFAAYRGYFRHHGRPLLFIALGFFLVASSPLAEDIIEVIGYSHSIGEIAEVIFTSVGVLCFVFAVYGPYPMVGSSSGSEAGK